MSDGAPSRRQPHPFLDQTRLPTLGHADLSATIFTEPTARAARPVSWHPSSHLAHTQLLPPAVPQYGLPPYHDMDLLAGFPQFPPTPAAYSGYTSPSSTFSPLSLPYSGFEVPGYFSPADWAGSAGAGPNALPSPIDCQLLGEQAAALPVRGTQEASDSSPEWDAFVANGFDRCTAPPTPDSFPAVEQLLPKVPAEESIPYQPLEDDEPEGEILIGMGLYDPPEKEVTDPTLESYRSSVASLLGEAYKYPEPTGKGLKLEDAWEPPETDDEQDDDDDDDEDNDDDEKDAEADE